MIINLGSQFFFSREFSKFSNFINWGFLKLTFIISAFFNYSNNCLLAQIIKSKSFANRGKTLHLRFNWFLLGFPQSLTKIRLLSDAAQPLHN